MFLINKLRKQNAVAALAVLMLLVVVWLGMRYNSGTRLEEWTLAMNSVGQICVHLRVNNRALRYCNIHISSDLGHELTNVPMWSFSVQTLDVPLVTATGFDTLKVTCHPEAGSGGWRSFRRAIGRYLGSPVVCVFNSREAFPLSKPGSPTPKSER